MEHRRGLGRRRRDHGEITLMDFAWLVNHFGMIGDE